MSEQIGSAAEEALKLLAAAQEWARTRLDSDHLATGSPACTVCPVCQAVGALRHVSPEAVDHLLDAAASFVAALKTVVTTPADGAPPPSGRVQHIDIRED